MEFQGKLALITGGSSGIGLEVARQLAGLGTNVAILARRQDQLELAKSEILSHQVAPDQQIHLISADVAKFDQVTEIVSKFMAEVGVPDILVNSAGIVVPGKFINITFTQYSDMISVNYLGMVNLCKLIIPEMVKRHSGYVVNVCSMAALFPLYGYTGYAGSKYAVRGFTDSLRQEMRLLGIDISIVYPPDTNTPQLQGEIPNRPAITQALAETNSVVEPELVARAIIHGMERKKYVIIPGTEAKILAQAGYLLGNALHTVIDMLINMNISRAKKKSRKD